MSNSLRNVLCRYFYDPLDQLTGTGTTQATGTQRFYQDGRVITELEQDKQTAIFRHQAQPLAQQPPGEGAGTALFMTDLKQTVTQASTLSGTTRFALTVYGFHQRPNGFTPIVGFNGECPDVFTGHVPLGQGRRFYNPILMRFNSPDKFSPFGLGGPNAYTYCENDPINFIDPSGAAGIPPTRKVHDLVPHAPSISINPYYSGKGKSYVIQQPDSSDSTRSTTFVAQGGHSAAANAPPPTKDSRSFFLDEILETTDVVFRTDKPATRTLMRQNLQIFGKAYDQLLAAGKIKTLTNSTLLEKLISTRADFENFRSLGLARLEAKNRVIAAQLQIKKYTISRYGLHGMLRLQKTIRKKRTTTSKK